MTSEESKSKMSRRKFVKIGAGAVVLAAAAGGAYFLSQGSSNQSVTTSTQSASQTATQSLPAGISSQFNFGSAIPFDTFDPHDGPNQCEWWLKYALYDTLVQHVYGTAFEKAPGLAKSWSTTDGKAWELDLQQGVKFHDGSEFDASAVAYNVERLMTLNKVPASFLAAIGIGAGSDYDPSTVEVVDKYTVRIHLPQAINNAAFEAPLSISGCMPIVSPDYVKKHEAVAGDWAVDFMKDHECGTGPYVLTQWQLNEFVTFDQYPDYWRGWSTDHPHIQRVVAPFSSEVAEQKTRLVNKEIDFAWPGFNWPADMADEVSKVSGIKTPWHPYISAAFIRLEQRRKDAPFKNVKLRQMVNYAFNMDATIQALFKGRAYKANSFLPYGAPEYDESIKGYQYDSGKAKELLADAGYKPGELTVHALFNEEFAWKGNLLQAVQSNLADIGVNMDISKVLSAEFIDTVLNKPDAGYDMYPFMWETQTTDTLRSFVLFNNYYQTPKGFNVGWTNSEFEQILNQALVELDQTKYMALMKQMQQVVMDDAPNLFCWSMQVPDIYWDWVKGFTTTNYDGKLIPWTNMWVEGKQ